MACIGLDLTPLPAHRTGVGTFVEGLLLGLVRSPDENRFVLYTKPTDRALTALLDPARFQVHETNPRSRPARMFWEHAVLPGLVRRHSVDLLHSIHYSTPLTTLSARRVVTFHDATFLSMPDVHQSVKRLVFPALMRHSARVADAVHVPTASTRRDILRFFPRLQRRLLVAPYGIVPAFSPGEPDSAVLGTLGARQPYALWVGTREPRKGLATLLRGFAAYRRAGGALRLVLAGALGWGRATPETLPHGVFATGFVSRENLVALLRGAAALVFPSLAEGFGYPPLEAMACGVPVCAPRISIFEETLGTAALFFAPGDARSLAQALAQLESDAPLRASLRRLGLQQAARFSVERQARSLVSLWRRVLERDSASLQR